MHKLFSNTYSIMYRIQLAVKRIPNHIKTYFCRFINIYYIDMYLFKLLVWDDI
jgi:hypothetical protein